MKKTIFTLITLTLISICIAACGSAKSETSKSSTKPINIKYIGNSCFYITFSDGTTLISDPYPESMDTYFTTFPKDLHADIATISHDHIDHTAVNRVSIKKESLVLCQTEKGYTIGDVKITGYKSSHVANMGDNTIFIYEENGYKIVNLGETDTIPDKVKDAVKDADVVLSYAGEYGDIKNADLFNELKSLNASVIMPEHYSMNPDNKFYGQPDIDTIKNEIPKDYTLKSQKSYNVKKEKSNYFITAK